LIIDMGEARKSWTRELVDFALNRDVNAEIEEQRRILKADPRSARAHLDLGLLYYSQRRVGDAIAEYEAAIECDPLFVAAYRRLGELYVSVGEYERAVQYAREAAALGDRTLLEMFERYPDRGSSDPPADQSLKQQRSGGEAAKASATE
jgi:tetratricopeptide (TPR) repeat protein